MFICELTRLVPYVLSSSHCMSTCYPAADAAVVVRSVMSVRVCLCVVFVL